MCTAARERSNERTFDELASLRIGLAGRAQSQRNSVCGRRAPERASGRRSGSLVLPPPVNQSTYTCTARRAVSRDSLLTRLSFPLLLQMVSRALSHIPLPSSTPRQTQPAAPDHAHTSHHAQPQLSQEIMVEETAGMMRLGGGNEIMLSEGRRCSSGGGRLLAGHASEEGCQSDGARLGGREGAGDFVRGNSDGNCCSLGLGAWTMRVDRAGHARRGS